MKAEQKGSLFVLAAGLLWGSMGLFVRPLAAMGMSSLQISSVRMIMAAVLFNLLLLTTNKKGYAVEKKDLGWFAAMGIGSVGVMTWSYFASIAMTGLSVAAVLLYTSPIWITLFARIFFKERITPKKLLALILAFGGCVLVSTGTKADLSVPGIILGLISGLSYSLYSILGVVVLKKYEPLVITTYVFTICAVAITLIAQPQNIPVILAGSGTKGILLVIFIGIVTAFFPYLFYTIGLSYLEVGKAGIIATVEPMVATIFGILIYHENMTIFSGLGIAGILAANILLNLRDKHPDTGEVA